MCESMVLPEEGWRTHWPKWHANNNEDEKAEVNKNEILKIFNPRYFKN